MCFDACCLSSRVFRVQTKGILVKLQQPASLFRTFGLTISVILAVTAVTQLWLYGLRMPGIDFYQFWVVGTEIRQRDVGNVYSQQARAEIGGKWLAEATKDRSSRLYSAARRRPQLETFSTPCLYSVFAALSSGDYEVDYRCYLAGTMAISITAIVLICRSAGASATTTALWIAFFFGCFQPLRADIAVGNVNQLQVGVLALFVWSQHGPAARWRDILGGALLGFLVAFKPNLGMAVGLLLFSWMICGQWLKLFTQGVGLSMALVVSVVFSTLFFGSADCWLQWFSSLNELMTTQSLPVEAGNFSPAALSQHLIGGTPAKELALGVSLLSVVIVGLMAWSWRKNGAGHELSRDVMVLGVGTIAMLLGSRLAWLHYFELLIPAIIYCVMSVRLPRQTIAFVWGDRAISLAALVLVALIPIKWIVGFHDLVVPAVLCLTGTCLLAIQLVRESRRTGAIEATLNTGV